MDIVLIGFKEATVVQDLYFLIEKNIGKYITILDPDKFLDHGSSHDKMHLVVVTRDMGLREQVSKKIDNDRLRRYTYIDPTALVIDTAEVGEGSIIFPYSSVFSRAVLGADCMISPYSMVSHKSVLGQGVVMQPYSIIAGSSFLGSWSKMNVRSSILDQINVVDRCEIGASSTVTKNIIKSGRYIGSPARRWTDNQ
jgi:NDP-sugar pyrophosphorylase family protein